MEFFENRKNLDNFDRKALVFIVKYLDELIKECKVNQFKKKNERYPHLSRILIDRSERLLTPELEKHLIEIEKQYIEIDDSN